jgi:DNA-binding transcriptional LysR family regulator
MPKINLQRVSHFLLVVDHGSLGKAAAKSRLTQPALTKSIAKLEEELGTELFDRSASFRLNAFGRSFLPRARELVAQAFTIEREVDLLRGGRIGKLRVFCGPTVAETVIAPALSRLVDRNPDLRIEIEVGDFHRIPDLLRESRIDLGVGEISKFTADPDLAIAPLPPEEIVFVCRSGHPLVRHDGTPVALDDFFSYPLVATELPEWAVRWLEAHHPGKTARDVLTLSSNNYFILKSVLATTDGVSGLPAGVVRRELDAGLFSRLHLETPPLKNFAGVIHLKDRTLSAAARLFVDALVDGRE